jgi:hypothetical protein
MKAEQSSKTVVIPNPIYDVVFRYLMEDMESAKIILSILINENIKQLRMDQTSHAKKREKHERDTLVHDSDVLTKIQLFHLDFVATVELSDGSEELVMIELQKAARTSDIFRFKRYISKNFQRKTEVIVENTKTKEKKVLYEPVRLVPIFILNFEIENEINDPLIRVSRTNTGIFSNQILAKKNDYIDNLSYDLWVVQVPHLNKVDKSDFEKDEYKNKLYSLIKLFDQSSIYKGDEHRLKIHPSEFSPILSRVITRLQTVLSDNPDIEDDMHNEDDLFRELAEKDNTISYIETKLEENKKALEENKKVLEEKDKALEEKDKVIYNMAALLKKNGVPVVDICKQTGFSREEIEKL